MDAVFVLQLAILGELKILVEKKWERIQLTTQIGRAHV